MPKQNQYPAIDSSQSLVQIYGIDFKPSDFRSGLVLRCERLLLTPLEDFQAGDFRVMLHQQFYPQTLIPLVLHILEESPLLDAGYYPGDLLCAVMHQKTDFWHVQPELLSCVDALVKSAKSDQELSESVREEIEAFENKISLLKNIHKRGG